MGILASLFGQTALQIEWAWLGGTICLALLALWFIIWILIAVWVYRDAESRGMGGALWLIIVILLGLLGIIIYLIVRSDKPILGQQPQYMAYQQYPQQYPPQYPQQYPPQYQQPPAQPGQQPPVQQPYQPPAATPPAGRMCPKCGAPVAEGAQFCQSCGNRM